LVPRRRGREPSGVRCLRGCRARPSPSARLGLTGASPASAALPAGEHILASGSNQYGSYEFVEQSAVTPHASKLIARPANGGGCNNGEWIQVCAAVTGAALKVSEMTNKTYFPWPTGTAEVETLSPSGKQLASWFGDVPKASR
jgi:hypothetical protein